MSEFKGSKGFVRYKNYNFNLIEISVGEKKVAEVKKCVIDSELEANANLIVDAFKVRQQINCELSELLEQRNEMLEKLEYLSTDNNLDCDTLWDIKQLIKKVKDNE